MKKSVSFSDTTTSHRYSRFQLQEGRLTESEYGRGGSGDEERVQEGGEGGKGDEEGGVIEQERICVCFDCEKRSFKRWWCSEENGKGKP